MRDLRVGDRVRVGSAYSIFHGELGEVITSRPGNRWDVMLDIGTRLNVKDEYLIPLLETTANDDRPKGLRIGDRVIVNKPISAYHAETGAIIASEGSWRTVRFDRNGIGITFPEKHLLPLADEPQAADDAEFQAAIATLGDDRPAQWDAEAEATFYRLMAHARERRP